MDTKSQPDGILHRLISFILHKMCLSISHDSEVAVEFRHTSHDNEQMMLPKGSDGKKVEVMIDGEEKLMKRSVTIKEDETNKGTEDEREKISNDEQHQHEDTKPNPPRHWEPLLSVASNINQKAESFISSRKKAMGRNTTFDPDKS